MKNITIELKECWYVPDNSSEMTKGYGSEFNYDTKFSKNRKVLFISESDPNTKWLCDKTEVYFDHSKAFYACGRAIQSSKEYHEEQLKYHQDKLKELS